MLTQKREESSPASRPSSSLGTTGGAFRRSHHVTLPSATVLSADHCAVLQRAFQRSGGLATGDELALVMRSHCDQPVSMLARWIVRKQLVCLVWRSQTLIPMFQFALEHCSVRAGITETIVELSGALDDLEMIEWFARLNGLLAGAAPADIVATDIQEVINAARADRFVALG